MNTFFQIFLNARNIPGIKKIGVLAIKDIPEDFFLKARVGNVGLRIPSPEWIDAISPVIKVTSEVKTGSVSFSSVLEFSMTGTPPEMPVALVAVDSAGHTWLISAPQPHYGSLTHEVSTSTPDGDPVAVKCKMSVSFIPIAVAIMQQ